MKGSIVAAAVVTIPITPASMVIASSFAAAAPSRACRDGGGLNLVTAFGSVDV